MNTKSKPNVRPIPPIIAFGQVQYVTCPAPENFHIIKPTFESVTLVWKSEARAISILIREDNATSWGKEIPSSAKDTIELYGLAANTTYWIRMRMTCAPGDISEWSDSVQCATLNYPSCYPPTNLHAIAITPTSVQLTWTPSQKTYEYNILFKASTAAKYDTTIGHFATIYTINNLKANTAYTWQVQSRCAQLLYSQYSNASNFTTLPISLESSTDFKKGFTVYSQNGQIHIVNLRNQRIEQVEILSLEGKLLGNYPIHNSDHILIPTNLQNTMVLIRLQTVKGSIVYKNLVK
ncbi:MAG: fibronectin type III domain-containing protein [Bacteroidales bacterium]